jgi:two-component system OmpR family response regulator
MELRCADGQGWRVLVIDNEPDIVELLDRMLRSFGYSVVRAPSCVDAVQVLQAAEIDLVIADERVFRRDGDAVHSALRAATAGVPILLLSGSMYGDSCPADVLQKPFHLFELRDRVAAAIRRSRETTV